MPPSFARVRSYSGGVKFGAVAENPLERLIVRLNLAPQPLLDTQMAYTLARVIMVGPKLGVFEALAEGPGGST